ncbi:hypothetical protein TorRG33x02_333760, partial [Trema orientale]
FKKEILSTNFSNFYPIPLRNLKIKI